MKAVILVNFGGPRNSDETLSFLKGLFSDVLPRPLKPFAGLFAKLRASKAQKMYDEIGGASPVVGWTKWQAASLEKKLGPGFKAYVGMMYGSPSIDEAAIEAKSDGADDVLVLPLFPYRSRYTSDNGMFAGLKCCRKDWHTHPLYISAIVDSIRSSLSAANTERPLFLFSAHAVPMSEIKRGCNYVKDVSDSVAKIMGSFLGFDHVLAFQSATGPVKWTGPDVRTVINGTSSREILLIPLGFACENVETLFEMDKIYKPYAESLGISMIRVPCLNDHPLFIDLLHDLALEER